MVKFIAPEIKTIQIKLLGKDFRKLKKLKGERSWYEFLLEER